MVVSQDHSATNVLYTFQKRLVVCQGPGCCMCCIMMYYGCMLGPVCYICVGFLPTLLKQTDRIRSSRLPQAEFHRLLEVFQGRLAKCCIFYSNVRPRLLYVAYFTVFLCQGLRCDILHDSLKYCVKATAI